MRFPVIALTAALSAPLAAWSFPIGPQPPSPAGVVEYFNTEVARYVVTANTAEQQAIEAGAAGPSWTRTGLDFTAFVTVEASRFNGTACDTAPDPCVPVSRFYGPAANSHFYTG